MRYNFPWVPFSSPNLTLALSQRERGLRVDMDNEKLKDKASDAFAKGKFSRAAELYAEYCAADPKDRQACLRMGDAWAKAGNRERAISAYRSAAEAFAKEGFLPRAIAASKLILELDPGHRDVQQMLASLYAQKSSIQRKPTGPISVPATTSGQATSKAVDIWAGEEASVLSPPAAASNEKPPAVIAIGEGETSPAASKDEPTLVYGNVKRESSLLSAPAAASNQKPPAGASIAEGEVSVLSPPAAASKQEPTVDAALAEAATSVLSPPAAASKQEPSVDAAFAEGEASVLSPPAAASKQEPTVDAAIAEAAASAPKPPPPSKDGTLTDVLLAAVEKPVAPQAPASDAATEIKPAPSNPSPSTFSFTELELEEGSLLDAVEAAAIEGLRRQAGPNQGAPVLEADQDESTEERASEPLPKIPLFSDLPPDAFVQLFERCPLRRYAMGEEIIAQGTTGHCFYVICAGSVAVIRLQDGKRTQITTLPEGSFFGEMALLSSSPRAASVESASEETQLLEISRSVLSELSQRYPTVARALRKFYRQRLLTNVMKTSRLFQPFNKADRGELVRRFRWRDVRKGETIVREGAETDGLYVVLSGEVEVRKGNQTVLAKLKEGDLFGEISLLTKTPATATVISTRRTSLLYLPRADFDSLIFGHPQVLMLVSELTDERRGKAQATLSQQPQQSLMI